LRRAGRAAALGDAGGASRSDFLQRGATPPEARCGGRFSREAEVSPRGGLPVLVPSEPPVHVLGPCHRHPLGHRVPPPPAFALTLDVPPRGCAWNSSVADRPGSASTNECLARGLGAIPLEGRGSTGVLRLAPTAARPRKEQPQHPCRSPRRVRGVGIALRLDPWSASLLRDRSFVRSHSLSSFRATPIEGPGSLENRGRESATSRLQRGSTTAG
jgi:hypothetical protein